MPIERLPEGNQYLGPSLGRGVALFLFAHPDDEFGVFSQIERELRRGNRTVCIYVTDGAITAHPEAREAESRSVLIRIGVNVDDIFFVGTRLGIKDGHLHLSIDTLARWLRMLTMDLSGVTACYVPAWEGGHPDHDLLHATVTLYYEQHGALDRLRQYPLYNGKGCRGPFFRVLYPLNENGPTQCISIGWAERWRNLKLCLSYPSQWRSWVGLFPFVLLHYLTRGVQQVQQVDPKRLLQRPHCGVLYYERRGFLDWKTVHGIVLRLMNPG
jgi:LmbE family N-acetylglucosaminyl deacetylase